MGAEVVHGILRNIFLTPYVGDFRARQIGVFTGSLLVMLIVFLMIRWVRADRTSLQVLAGVVWLVLTVAFEVGFGHFVLRRPWSSVIEDFDLLRGGLLPLGLVVLALSPLVAARFRTPYRVEGPSRLEKKLIEG